MPSSRDKISDTTNSRQFPRVVCSLPARVSFAEIPVADCIVKDLSEAGFRLLTLPAVWIPSEFTIVCDEFGTPKLAQQIWRRDGTLGARFIT